ncbi:hypothetical protein BR93DRAFT_969939 [Coniochaeta sp. PMI_546]|nr:hypothetical protein BR93DRAFT_969939 [Coniochaeta sp. PMI_546]
MAGSDDINPVKCRHYARFAAHLDRAHFDVIYWVLFFIVICMLFAASWRYGRAIDAVERFAAGSAEHKRMMKQCMLVCGIYALISVVAVVMEVFALMALQFCDGEDLMALYWSTWTVMQIGSLIAIFGVLLAVFHTIRGRKHPPWALALGTPVLVVAGLGHIIQGALHKKVKSARGRSSISRTRQQGRSEDVDMSTTDTILAEDSEKDDSEYHYKATLLGYTPDGATILQFCQTTSSLSPMVTPSAQARIIGTNTHGQVIVAFRNGKATITAGANDAERPPTLETPTPRRSKPSVGLEERLSPGEPSPTPPNLRSPTVAGSSSPETGTSPAAFAGTRSAPGPLSTDGSSHASPLPRGASSA